MAKTPIKSALSWIKYSTVSYADIATNGKAIVCLINLNWSKTTEVTNEDTFCGNYPSVGAPANEISGEGLNMGDLATNEASFMDLEALMEAGTKVYMNAKNMASSPITEGQVFDIGDRRGYLSSLEMNNDHPGNSRFSFTWVLEPAE
jgi:hypothetical protein